MLGAKILESDLKQYMVHIQSLPKQSDSAIRKGSSSSMDDEKSNGGSGNAVSSVNSTSKSAQKVAKPERGGLASILV